MKKYIIAILIFLGLAVSVSAQDATIFGLNPWLFSGTNVIERISTYKVGVASTTPAQTFSVQGNALISGTLWTGGLISTTTAPQFKGIASASGSNCLQINTAGVISNTGSACGGAGSSPGDPPNSIQFNGAGSFVGSSQLLFSAPDLILGGDISISGGNINFGNGTATSSLTSSGGILTIPVASTTSFSIGNLLNVSGAGTSTFTGSLTAGALAVGTSSPSALYGTNLSGRFLAGGEGTSTINGGGTALGGVRIKGNLLVNGIEILGGCKGCPAGGGTPAGGAGDVQYSDGANFDAEAAFDYSESTDLLTVINASTTALSVANLLNVNGTGTSTNAGSQDITSHLRVGSLEILGACKGCPGGGGGVSSGIAGTVQFSDGASGFSGDANTLFWDNSAKRLGVGTATPGATLSVAGQSLFTSTSTFLGGLISPSISATSSIGFYTGGNAAPRLYINSNGNIGIGTTTPSESLTIHSQSGIINFNSVVTNPTGVQGLRFDENTQQAFFFGYDGSGAGNANNLFIQDVATGPRLFTFLRGGNFGIATGTPGTALGVSGAGVFTNSVTGLLFKATSTTNASIFPIASTTSFSVDNLINVSGAGTSTFSGGVSVGGTLKIGNTGGTIGCLRQQADGSIQNTGGDCGGSAANPTVQSDIPLDCESSRTNAYISAANGSTNSIAPGNAYFGNLEGTSTAGDSINLGGWFFGAATTSEVACIGTIPKLGASPNPSLVFQNYASSSGGDVAMDLDGISTTTTGGEVWLGMNNPFTNLQATTSTSFPSTGAQQYQGSTTIRAFSSPALVSQGQFILRIRRYGANANDTLRGDLFIPRVWIRANIAID